MGSRMVQTMHLLNHFLPQRVWNQDSGMASGNVDLEDLLVWKLMVNNTQAGGSQHLGHRRAGGLFNCKRGWQDVGGHCDGVEAFFSWQQVPGEHICDRVVLAWEILDIR